LIEWQKLNYKETIVKRFSLLMLYLLTSLLAACSASQATADVPSAELADYRVIDLQGDTIAQVEDVLIAADSGQISYALVILERGPFRYGRVASSDRAIPRTAVPWDYFLLDLVSGQLELQADRSVLYAAPLLLDKPDELAAGWDADIRAYWQAYPVSSRSE
jgi:sporulation protein YlmC with PRC-barrel domain